ncbi:MAG TPA: DNA-formamidopyrimidine glycosylase family protein [Ohtaekwangia sp.]
MPEGPSIVILKEEALRFKGKKILEATGNTKKLNPETLTGLKITDLKTWGKHFLICFPTFTVRIHFLLFGSYLINDQKPTKPRLHLKFKGGEINFYACAIQLLEKPLDDIYDWTADIMNKKFDAKQALIKLNDQPKTLVCDAILDQSIFSGAGNIFKNEVLFRIKVHPKSKLGDLPAAKKRQLIHEVVNYSFDFLKWKKAFVLRKNWQAHTKRICPRDGTSLTKAYLGKTNRRTFFCKTCQKLY